MSYRSGPPTFALPPNVTLKPLISKVDSKKAYFIDDTDAEIDVIMFCTGYKHSYPFMDDPIRFKPMKNQGYFKELYKGLVFIENPKILYLGTFSVATLPMFDCQAYWALKYINGEIQIPSKLEMMNDSEKMIDKLSTIKGIEGAIKFLMDYTLNLGSECNFGPGLDRADLLLEKFHGKLPEECQGLENRQESGFDILNYRELQHQSVISKVKSAKQKIPFMKNFDDSLEHFLNNYE